MIVQQGCIKTFTSILKFISLTNWVLERSGYRTKLCCTFVDKTRRPFQSPSGDQYNEMPLTGSQKQSEHIQLERRCYWHIGLSFLIFLECNKLEKKKQKHMSIFVRFVYFCQQLLREGKDRQSVCLLRHTKQTAPRKIQRTADSGVE